MTVDDWWQRPQRHDNKHRCHRRYYPALVPVQLPLHQRRLLSLGPQHVHLVRQAPAGLLRALQLLLCVLYVSREGM